MNSRNRIRLSTLALCVSIAVGTLPALAQNTTSAVGGRVTAADGKPAAGAQVKIVHVESGSVNDVVTDADGRYSVRGLRVGGPYTITITKAGVTDKRDNVFLQLAETTNVDSKLGTTQALDTVVVTGSAIGSDKFSPTAMGAGTSIGRNELDALASIQRSLQDYARLDPRLSQTDKERGEISAGGQNTRYNSITIDGVTTNDTFGLEANNLPTFKQPISIDAIQSVQVNVSNYDVTQKGYTGANINAVTKSGTNEFKGSVYWVGRDSKLVGQRFNRTTNTYIDPPTFEESTKGVTLGGPIIKDKLFFFASYEDLESTRNAPSFGPIGSGQTNVGITQSLISSAGSLATSRYNMNIGSFAIPGGSVLASKDTLLKIDWNIAAGHRANVRYAKTEQAEPIFPSIFNNSVSLNSHWYNQGKVIETAVAQWFADWSDKFSTEVKYSTRDYDSVPANNSNLPQVTFSVTGALSSTALAGTPTGTRSLVFGTERSRHTNVLRTKTTDIYMGGNLLLNEHEIKFGVDQSENEMYNAFLQDTKGQYTFSCVNSSATYTYNSGPIVCGTATAEAVEAAILENFSRGRPSSYQVQVPVAGGSLDNGIANWSLKNTGFFAQNTWSFNPQLTLMFGFRVDAPNVPSKPLFNSAAASAPVAGSFNRSTGAFVRETGGFGRDNSVTIDGENLFQPRFGFNYTFEGKRQQQIRGGFGLFQGAAANVWLSNPYSNTGVATRIIGCGGSFTACPVTGGVFSADPNNQPTNFTGASPAANVDYIQKGLGQPAVWKANLAFERELTSAGLVFSAEYLYTKTETGIYYQHLNLGAPTLTGTDGRQLFWTNGGYNPNCWSAGGVSSTTTTGCGDLRNRALSNAGYSQVLQATKTKQGGGNTLTLQIQRPMKDGFAWMLAYNYNDATEVSPLTSSVANSNFNSRSVFNPNEDVKANSAYLVRDRFNGSLQWQRNFIGNYRTSFGVTYEGRKGKPYSWTYTNDMNGDGVAGNDLIYIPRAPGSGDVIFRGDTPTNTTMETRFWDIVNANPDLANARGSVVKRNDSFAPWTNSFDLRISQQLPGLVKGHRSVLSFDILNFGNMLNKKWGRIDEVAFNGAGGQRRTFVGYAGIDPATGKYIYTVVGNPTDLTTRQERGESQWALQMTYRYEF